MATHKGQAHAKGHSHGAYGHGGHHSGSHTHNEPNMGKDHLHNDHNSKHMQGHTPHEDGGSFPQGLTEGM